MYAPATCNTLYQRSHLENQPPWEMNVPVPASLVQRGRSKALGTQAAAGLLPTLLP